MVDAVTTAANIQTRASSSSASLAQNFDTFLTLLTAQLQNQDPLEPVDSTEFTNQLVSSPALSNKSRPTRILQS